MSAIIPVLSALAADLGPIRAERRAGASEDVSEPKIPAGTPIDNSSSKISGKTPINVSAETPNVKFRPDPPARKADALAVMAESFLAQGAAALKGGDRHQIVAIQRALNARDRGCCRFPGCPNTRYLDGHHIQHWAHGGETKLSNLVSLCRFHHRQVHEGNVVVLVLDDGAIRFVTPNGKSFDSTLLDHTQPLGDWHQLVATHEQQDLHIDRHTAVTRWDGGTCDYAMATEALLHHWRGRPITATEVPMRREMRRI